MNIITFPDSPYRLHQPFEPAGDPAHGHRATGAAGHRHGAEQDARGITLLRADSLRMLCWRGKTPDV